MTAKPNKARDRAVTELRDAADLLESQAARIDELERALAAKVAEGEAVAAAMALEAMAYREWGDYVPAEVLTAGTLLRRLGAEVGAPRGAGYEILPGPAILCRTCSRTSHNPNDVAQRYCGHCHVFHDDVQRRT